MSIKARINKANLRDAMRSIYEQMQVALDAGVESLDVVVREPTKLDLMRRKSHAMIADIHAHVTKGAALKRYTPEMVKAVMVNQFEHELKANGEALGNPSGFVWDWVNDEKVTRRASTEQFTQKEYRQFIEFLYSQGAEYEVVWSEESINTYKEWNKVN